MIVRNVRYDYFLIWGHGLKYGDQILDLIRNHSDLSIIKILYHYPKSISKLVKSVYSYDYAPFNHLRDKTRYLMSTPKEVLFIFAENHNPDEDYFGVDRFRHIESRVIKKLKEQMRDSFNERVNGKRTEKHVVHASDNESQTHFILKYLGLKGTDIFKKNNTLPNLPYYLSEYRNFTIKNTPINSLMCNIAVGNRSDFHIETVEIEKSPHYRCLAEDMKIYQEYIDRFIGGPLTVDYNIEKYLKLAKDFEYLCPNYTTDYISAIKSDGRYIIVDGLHRAAIISYKNSRAELPIAILERS